MSDQPTLDVHMNDAMYRRWCADLLRLGAQREALLAALVALLPLVESHQDAGPHDEGWQSEELLQALSDARAAIAKVTETS